MSVITLFVSAIIASGDATTIPQPPTLSTEMGGFRNLIIGHADCSYKTIGSQDIDLCGRPVKFADGTFFKKCNVIDDVRDYCHDQCQAKSCCDFFSVVKTDEGCNCTMKSKKGVSKSISITNVSRNEMYYDLQNCHVNIFNIQGQGFAYDCVPGSDNIEERPCAWTRENTEGGTWSANYDEVSWDPIMKLLKCSNDKNLRR